MYVEVGNRDVSSTDVINVEANNVNINNIDLSNAWLSNSELNNAIKATYKEAQYDASAKRLLGHKNILAHILVKAVDDFKGMNPKDVVKNIEGTPYISMIPVEPGLTNISNVSNMSNQTDTSGGHRLIGMNTENEEINEGLIRFDIVFYVRTKDGLSQIIINVEAQKDEPTRYQILNRAIFYVSRLISSQKERDFENTNYNDIKKVYSIWVCMNMDENTMSHIHLTQDDVVGSYKWKGNLDLINIVMIGLGKNLPEHDDMYELHRLLGTLLSNELLSDEKLDIIGNEYDIPIEEKFRKDVGEMCNLSQGVKEAGIAIGERIGQVRGEVKAQKDIVGKMYKNGFSIEQIAQITEIDIKDIKDFVS